MNHRPFEEWLLEDEPLTAQQGRELQIHLRDCSSCAAIADSNLALHSTRPLAPLAGFTDRFRPRLAAWRQQQVRRQIVGTLVLVIGGLAVVYTVAAPALQAALDSPAAWITSSAAYLVFLLTYLRVLDQVAGILARSLPGFIPSGGRLAIAVAACGIGLLWIVTMRRLARAQQGA